MNKKPFPTIVLQLINIEGMVKIENHYLTDTTVTIILLGKIVVLTEVINGY